MINESVYQKIDGRHACHAAMRVTKWSHHHELCRDNQSKRARFAGRKWDKTFAESAKVTHRKVTFQNRYGITTVGDLYIPKIAASASWRRLQSAAPSAR